MQFGEGGKMGEITMYEAASGLKNNYRKSAIRLVLAQVRRRNLCWGKKWG